MSALASANPRNFGVKRIMKEYAEFERDAEAGSNDYFSAKPCEDNLFEWHFTIRGPPDSDFAGGRYHGRILLPAQYPFKPPDIMMLTPSGRFETNKKICLSISSFHPKNWQPSWSIRTVLTALIAFFPTPGNGAIGSLEYSPAERREYAARSGAVTCELCGGKSNLEMLPDLPAGAAERSGASVGPPALPADVLATIDQNKGIPALSGVSQPGTPAHGSSAPTTSSQAPPTPLALSQGARIAASMPSNPMSPMLLRTFSEPVKLAPGQSQGVGEGSMTMPPPTSEEICAAAPAAASTPSASSSSTVPAISASSAATVSSSAPTPLLAPLVLDEGLRQRQGRVVLANEQQQQQLAQNNAPVAAHAQPAAPAVAVAAARAQALPQQQRQQQQGGAPLSSVTVLLTLLILLILARKLYSSVRSKPSFGLDRDFLSD